MQVDLIHLGRELELGSVYRLKYGEQYYGLCELQGQIILTKFGDGGYTQTFTSLEDCMKHAMIAGTRLADMWHSLHIDIIRGTIGDPYTFADFTADLTLGHEFRLRLGSDVYGISRLRGWLCLAQYASMVEPQYFETIHAFIANAKINGRRLEDVWVDVRVEVVF